MNIRNSLNKCLLLLVLLLLGTSSAMAESLPTGWTSSSFTQLGNGSYKFLQPVCLSENITIVNGGDLNVRFVWTNGSWKYSAIGVDLIDADGNVAYHHYSKSDINSSNPKTYTLTNVQPGDYKIRYISTLYNGDGIITSGYASRGNITFSGSAASGVTHVITSWSNTSAWQNITYGAESLWSLLAGYSQYPTVQNVKAFTTNNLSLVKGTQYDLMLTRTSASGTLNIKGIEILNGDGNVVAADYHDGVAGATSSNNMYSLFIPETGTFSLRIVATGNTDCSGKIDLVEETDWTVNIPAEYSVSYKGKQYRNGEAIKAFQLELDELKTNATGKFVWGPIINETAKTVTFSVYKPETEIKAGNFYKMQLFPNTNGWYHNSGSNVRGDVIAGINSMSLLSKKGSYIYLIDSKKTSNYAEEYSGVPDDISKSFMWVETVSGTNVGIKLSNNNYIHENGSNQSNAAQIPFVANADNTFLWNKNVGPWNNSVTASHVTTGLTGSFNANTTRFYFHVPTIEEFAEAFDIDATFDKYTIVLQGTEEAIAAFTGVTYLGPSRYKIATRDADGNYYLLLSKGTTLTAANLVIPEEATLLSIENKVITLSVVPMIKYNVVLKTQALRVTPVKAQIRTEFEELLVPGASKVAAPGSFFALERTIPDASPFTLINTGSFAADYIAHMVLNADNRELGIYGRALPYFLPRAVVSAVWSDINLAGDYVKSGAVGADETHSAGKSGNYRWQFIGNRFSFALRDENGNFMGYDVNTGKMVVVSTLAEAATFRLEGSTADHEKWCVRLNEYSTIDGDPIYWSKAADGTITIDTDLANVNNVITFASADAPVNQYDYRVVFSSAIFKGYAPVLKMGDIYAPALLVDYNKNTALNGGVLTVKAAQASRIAASMFTVENMAELNALGYAVYDDDIVVDNVNHVITIYARFKPKFLVTPTVSDYNWYSMYMPNTNVFITGNEAGSNQVVNPNNVASQPYRFQFIGLENRFKIRNENGKYAAWSSSGRLTWVDTFAAGEFFSLAKNTSSNGQESWSIKRGSEAWNHYSAAPTGIGVWNDESKSDNRIIFAPLTAKEYYIIVHPSVGSYGPVTIPTSVMPMNARGGGDVVIETYDYDFATIFDEFVLQASTYQLANPLPAGQGLLIDYEPEDNSITVRVGRPKIVHRRNYLYDVLDEAVAQGNAPENGFIEQGDGMAIHPNTGEKIQYTSTYDIYKFMKKGERRYVYFPTINIQAASATKMTAYHRYYDYGSESIKRLAEVIPDVTGRTQNREVYENGYVFIPGIGASGMNVTLPADTTRYDIGVDMTRGTDYQRNYNGSNLLEPSIGQRVIYHIQDANVIAQKLHAGNYEVHEIAFPTKKLGRDLTHSGFDVLSLDYDFENYWIYNNGTEGEANLVNITNLNQLEFEVVGNPNNENTPGKIRYRSSVSSLNARYQHQVAFLYPEVDGQLIMPDNAEQIINVYMKPSANSNYRVQIAQFKLTFMPSTELIPINELFGYTGEVDATGRPIRKSERSSKAMRELYGEPIAKVTFDNKYVSFRTETGATASGKKVYGIPLDFNKANIAFGTLPAWADWAEYRITQQNEMSGGASSFYYPVEMYEQNLESFNKTGTGLANIPDGKFLFYNDATEQPGKAMSLELGGDLCPGARLYMTGWVGSNCVDDGGYHHVAMHVAVVGIKGENERKTIYTYNPGVISSAYVSESGIRYTGIDYNSFKPYSNNNNAWALWNQVAFSFLIPADEHYDNYELEVYTDCYGATGADILLDNFEVFVSEPKATVDFTTPLCTDVMRHVKIHTDYDMVMGNRHGTSQTVPVSFCFLDREVYDNYLDEYLYDVVQGDMIVDAAGNPILDDKGNIQYEKIRVIKPGLSSSQIDAYYNKAFGDALIGERKLQGEGHAFHNFDIDVNYENIEPYVFHTSTEDKIYRETVGGERRIVFKETVSTKGMSPNHNWQVGKEYYLVYSPIKVTESEINLHDVGTAVYKVNTRCCFLDVFTVKGPVEVKGDAEISSFDNITACKGQAVTLAVDLAGRKETGDMLIKDLIYDWYVGPAPTAVEGDDISKVNEEGQTIYRANRSNYMFQHKTVAPYQDNDGNWVTDLTLEYALNEFRKYYRTQNTTKGAKPIEWHEQEHNINLTQDMIDYITEEIDAGRLILFRKTLSLPLTEKEAFMVPLFTQKLDEHGVPETDAEGNAIMVPVLDEHGNQVYQEKIFFTVIPIRDNKYDVDEEVIYCPDPQEVSIHLTGIAPTMSDGFEGKNYPTDMISVPLRVGLNQINDVRISKFNAQNRNVLRIPLRNVAPSVSGEGGYRGIKLDPTNNKLVVVGTEDPTYAFTETDFENTNSTELNRYEVGQIVSIEAAVAEGSDNYMYVVFNDDKVEGGLTVPIFREGYTYTLKVPFIDDDSNVPEEDRSTACQGSMTIDMRIVPEYQAYVGDTNDDEWTNDAHWRRVTRAELYDNNRTLPSTSIYDANVKSSTLNSFVPMNFTNVLLSRKEVEREQTVGETTAKFYHSPKLYEPTVDADGFINNLSKNASRYIQYEMQVDASNNLNHAYECGLFGTNVAKNVTFETGTELLNAHFLNYQKAWVEYELKFNRWYTLGSPLQGTYAGEWYTLSSSARQTTLHFSPITYDEARNDRFRPAVYQRSWDKAEANVFRLNGDGLINGNTGAAVNVVTRGDWSNVYNDVRVNYSLGGFSVKVDPNYMAKKPAEGVKTLIRMPKDDASYTYYDFDNDSHGQQTTHNLNRVAEEHYRLYSDKLAESTTFSQTLTNAEAENNFFLVSNPFMAALDMEEFFRVNTDFEKKYWILTEEGQSANVRDEQSGMWIVTTAGGTFLTKDAKLSPLQAFFVKKTAGNTANVVFNRDMQVSRFNHDTNGGIVSGATLKAPAPVPADVTFDAFTITAERGDDVSTAVVNMNTASANSYSKNEDAETFVDSNVAEKPSVYTIASGKAMTINSISNFTSLPLGVYSTENEEVTLTFNGVASLGDNVMLIDHATGDKYQVYEGMSIVVSGNTNGRYELAPGSTGIEDAMTDGPVVSVVGNMVTVKAGNDPVLTVRAVDASGKLIYSHAKEVRELTFELPQGMFLVEVATVSTRQVEKVVIR